MVRVVVRVTGALLVAAGWALLLSGLFLLPPTDDPLVDLDAGASFGINIEVYLPAVATAVLLLVALPVVVVSRLGSLVGIGACMLTAALVVWVLGYQELLDYIPGLARALRLAGGVSVAALGVFAGELTLRRRSPSVPI